MATPRVDITLKEGGPPVPPADLTNIACIVGPGYGATPNVMQTITTEADLAGQHGPGPELAAAALNAGGNPVYFCPSVVATAGSSSTVVKTPKSAATPVTIGAGDSSILVTAKAQGLSIQLVAGVGNDVPYSHTFAAGALVVTLSTGGGGAINATPATLKTYLDGVVAVAAAFTFAAGGTGLGTMVIAGTTAIPFGSTAKLVVSSDVPVNRFDVVVRCIRGGAVAGTPLPTMQFSLDAGDDQKGGSWSPEKVIPSSGIVALNDSKITSGLSVTFTGTLEAGDLWRFTTVAPVSDATGITDAQQAALNDQTRLFGFFGIENPVDSSMEIAIDTVLQNADDAPMYKWLYAILRSRDQNAGEAASTWRDAINNDFNGVSPVTSAQGRTWLCSGAYRRWSSYTRRWYRSGPVYAAVRRRVSRPVHEDLGRRKTGALDDALSLYHDETLNASFSNNRQITMYTGGGIFFTKTQTLAPADSRYNRGPVVAVAMQLSKICCDVGRTLILDSLVADPKTGAIADEEARAIESLMEAPMRGFLFSQKKDGKISASPPSADQKMVVVLQNYNYLDTNELRIEAAWIPVGYNDAVKIGLTLQIPG